MDVNFETIQTDKVSMGFLRFGTGDKTFVILPGLSVGSLAPFAEAIAKQYDVFSHDYTVYLFDQPSNPPKPYSIKSYAQDIADAMVALGLSNADVFGASRGGMLGLQLAVDHPELVHKLALGSTPPHMDECCSEALSRWIECAEKHDGVGLYLDFCSMIYPESFFEENIEAFRTAGSLASDENLDHFVIFAQASTDFNIFENLDAISCPILQIASRDDKLVSLDTFIEFKRALESKPGCESYLYDSYGHASFDMAPDYPERLFRFFQK